MKIKVNWKESSFEEVCQHVQGKQIIENDQNVHSPDHCFITSVLALSDGTFIACESDKENDYSEVTPGDWLPPNFWIGTKI